MSAANPSPLSRILRRKPPQSDLAVALLELFELVVATTKEEPVFDRLAEWADEHKPRLEAILNGKASTKHPQE